MSPNKMSAQIFLKRESVKWMIIILPVLDLFF